MAGDSQRCFLLSSFLYRLVFWKAGASSRCFWRDGFGFIGSLTYLGLRPWLCTEGCMCSCLWKGQDDVKPKDWKWQGCVVPTDVATSPLHQVSLLLVQISLVLFISMIIMSCMLSDKIHWTIETQLLIMHITMPDQIRISTCCIIHWFWEHFS